MRIGTWNLEGRWDNRHLDLLVGLDCDVLLLTEVAERVSLPNHHLHHGGQWMQPARRWAVIASRVPLSPHPDPHGASALTEVEGLRVCASILPWRTCGTQPPWVGATTAEKTAAAVSAVEHAAPSVWGGDWNHALAGPELAGSLAGRHALLGALERLGLQVPTASAPHQSEGLLSIDHVAVPASWVINRVERHSAFVNGRRISDHDAYVVQAVEPLRD